MYNKPILNKLFICLINNELIRYINYFLLKKVPKNFFLKCFQNNAFV